MSTSPPNTPAADGPSTGPKKWYHRIGPGLITACVVIGPGSILTSSNVGAQQGYSMAWVVVLSVVFMLAAAYTFRHDGHVRVDIFYRGMTPRRQALVNILGILLLMIPVMVFVIASSYGYVANSWRIMETSSDYGGIPAVYALKTLIPVFALCRKFRKS